MLPAGPSQVTGLQDDAEEALVPPQHRTSH